MTKDIHDISTSIRIYGRHIIAFGNSFISEENP